MRWKGRRASSNIEDRGRGGRGGRGGGAVALGGGGGLVILGIVALVWLLGGDPMTLLRQLPTDGTVAMQPGGTTEVAPTPKEMELREFVAVVLADTEDVWNDLFARMGRTYREPTLVFFRDGVRSGCGFADSQVGPFYCPADEKVYLDVTFFEELSRRLGAPGDFAQAYVVAHEIGHHVQNLLGTSDQVHEARGRLGVAAYNELSVRLELQADYFAGVWAHHAQRTKNILERGDLEEAINAAQAIGDDTLQRRSTGRVVPDSFTHGTSAQRMRWFRKGFESGDPTGGDTFSIAEP